MMSKHRCSMNSFFNPNLLCRIIMLLWLGRLTSSVHSELMACAMCMRTCKSGNDIAENQAWEDHRHHQVASRPRLEWGRHRRQVDHFLLLLREALEALAVPGVLHRHGCNSNHRRNTEVTGEDLRHADASVRRVSSHASRLCSQWAFACLA